MTESELDSVWFELDVRNSKFLKAPVVQAPDEFDVLIDWTAEAHQFAIERLSQRQTERRDSIATVVRNREAKTVKWVENFLTQARQVCAPIGVSINEDRFRQLASEVVAPDQQYAIASPWRCIAFALASRGELSKASFVTACRAFFGKEYQHKTAYVYTYVKSKEFKALVERQSTNSPVIQR